MIEKKDGLTASREEGEEGDESLRKTILWRSGSKWGVLL